jgi:hypothetical protein
MAIAGVHPAESLPDEPIRTFPPAVPH